MSDTNFKQLYDDGNIPQIDLPQDEGNISVSGKLHKETNIIKSGNYTQSARSMKDAEPLPDSFRPRKNGPGGE